jgi:hypothetical protein
LRKHAKSPQKVIHRCDDVVRLYHGSFQSIICY